MCMAKFRRRLKLEIIRRWKKSLKGNKNFHLEKKCLHLIRKSIALSEKNSEDASVGQTSTIYLTLGTKFQILRGSVEVLGAILPASDTIHTVICAPWSPAIPLRGLIVPSQHPKEDSSEVLDDPNTFAFKKTDTTIKFLPFDTPFGSFNHKRCVFNDLDNGRRLHFAPLKGWTDALSAAVTLARSVYGLRSIVVGKSGIGKSSLSILLVNSLLNSFSSVYLLDIDPGQPLISSAGKVNLWEVSVPILTSGCMHYNQPGEGIKAVHRQYVGIDVKENAAYFMTAVANCVRKLKEGRNDIPLVINTHGFFKEIGLQTVKTTGLIADVNLYIDISSGQQTPQQDLLDTAVALTNPFSDLISEFKQTDQSSIHTLKNDFEMLDVSQRHIMTVEAHAQDTKVEKTLNKKFRWLRLAADFDSSFRYAMHIPDICEEEFLLRIRPVKSIVHASLSNPPVLKETPLKGLTFVLPHLDHRLIDTEKDSEERDFRIESYLTKTFTSRIAILSFRESSAASDKCVKWKNMNVCKRFTAQSTFISFATIFRINIEKDYVLLWLPAGIKEHDFNEIAAPIGNLGKFSHSESEGILPGSFPGEKKTEAASASAAEFQFGSGEPYVASSSYLKGAGSI